jgi:hypothetical protein
MSAHKDKCYSLNPALILALRDSATGLFLAHVTYGDTFGESSVDSKIQHIHVHNFLHMFWKLKCASKTK